MWPMQSLQVINCSILHVCVLIMNVYVAVLSVYICPSEPLIGIKNFELLNLIEDRKFHVG